ncbi:MAG TPA: DUF4129 domain-containing protein [Jatrophihabitans sp.]|nr:DUF4129 domain-containing protein [Jatrophihabitans sp.]
MVIVGAPPDPVGGASARQAAQAELRHREYHRDDPGLLSRFLHWVGRQIDALLTGGGGAHAVLIVLLLALAVVVIFAVRAGAPTRRTRIAGEDLDPLAPVAARDHRRIAEQLTAEGRRAEALREWLRATVAGIEERGVLPPRPGRTGAATAREAGPLLPAVAADLHAATTAFDEVWFGGREARDADLAVARAAADGVATARVAGYAAASAGIAVPW